MPSEAELLQQLVALRAQVEQMIAGLHPHRHSVDFASVYWDGASYSFTAAQSRVVRALWEATQNLTPEVRQETLREAAGGDDADDETGFRVRDLFRDHPAWGAMIVPGRAKGTFRLACDGPLP